MLDALFGRGRLVSDLLEYIEHEGNEWAAAPQRADAHRRPHQGGERHVFPFRSPTRFAPMPNEKTIYEIGSFSKVFTTSLLSVLVSRGVLSLDDTIGKFFADLDLDPEISDITVFELATHSSGMDANGIVFDKLVNEAVESNDFANYTYYERYKQQHLHQELRVTKLVRARATGWEYSPPDSACSATSSRLAAGEPYEPLLKEHICGRWACPTPRTRSARAGRPLRRATGRRRDVECVALGHHAPAGGHPFDHGRHAHLPRGQPRRGRFATDRGSPPRPEDPVRMARGLHAAECARHDPAEVHPSPRLAQPQTGQRHHLGTRGATFSYQSFGGVHQARKTGLCVLTSSAENLMDVVGFPGFGHKLLNEAIA